MSKKQLALSVIFRLKKFQTALGKATNRYGPFMKTTIIISTFIILLSSCDTNQKPLDQMMSEIREDFAKEAEISNAKTMAWKSTVDSLYKLADTNTFQAICLVLK